MTYRLIFSEKRDFGERDVGENVFVDNIPYKYKVYLFYYPNAMGDEEMESRLRQLGSKTGKNLFVNIGKLNDPQFDVIAGKFGIVGLPAIVMTADVSLASIKDEKYYSTAFVRLDSENILRSAEMTLKTIQKIFSLFVTKDISKAMAEAKKYELDSTKSYLKKRIVNALNKLGKFLSDRDISVSILEGKFELKRTATLSSG